MERKHGKDAKFKPWWKREVRRQVSRRHAGICERCGESCVHGLFERTQSRRAGISARNTPAFGEKKLGRSFRLFCFLVTNKVYRPQTAKMSKISNLFKGGSKHKSKGNPSAQEAIHKLRETEEMLTKKQDYLEKKIEQEIAIAKKHGTKNKRGIYICFYDGLKKCVHLFLHRGQARTHYASRKSYLVHFHILIFCPGKYQRKGGGLWAFYISFYISVVLA